MEWVSRVNWVDVLFLIIILRSIYVGSQRGFFAELFNILGMGIAIVLSIQFYSQIAAFLNKYLYIPRNISGIISFLAVAFLIHLLFQFATGLIKKVVKVEIFPNFNKGINAFGGPIIGFCKGMMVSLFIFLVLLLIPIGYVINSAKDGSLSGHFFARSARTLYEKTIGIIPSAKPVDITPLLAGAEPLKFKMFQPKKSDKLDDVIN